jgi:uncharacterized glyoxalase superfamily protein PhnB
MASSAKKATATRTRRAAARKPAVSRKRRAGGRKAVTTLRRGGPRKAAARVPAQSVVPMLSYEDGVAALFWLHRAFGFQEIARYTESDGRLSHGEMRAGAGLIMIASPTPDYQNPKRHREVCDQARKWSTVPWIIDGVLVYVDDLERHFARAKAGGATILSEIEQGPPGRRYRAEDIEGHRWFFFEREDG